MLRTSKLRFICGLGVSVIFVSTAFFRTATAQLKISEVFKRVAPSVVLIRTHRGGGTGFLVSSRGDIITALHVVDYVSTVSVKTNDGRVFDKVSLIARDEKRDLALLRIEGTGFPFSVLSTETINIGDQVIVLGNPLALESLEVTISTGIVSGIREADSTTKVLQITAPVSPGNSGGPVLSDSGNVVGVVSFKVSGGDSLNFAIPSIYCQELIDKAPSKPLLNWSVGGKDPFSKDFSNKSNILTIPPRRGSYDISGIWENQDGDSWLLNDDGINVELWRINSYGLSPKYSYKGTWVGDFALDSINGMILRPVDSRTVLWNWLPDFQKYRKKSPEKIKEYAKSRAASLTADSAAFRLSKVRDLKKP